MDPLHHLERADLEHLITLQPEHALGRIVELNALPRYHNRLNVIELLVRLRELRELVAIAGMDALRKVA